MFLVFETKELCVVANEQISANMGCSIVGHNAKTGLAEPTKQMTTQWAIPQQDINGKWFIPKPDDEYMTGVEDYSAVETVDLPEIEGV